MNKLWTTLTYIGIFLTVIWEIATPFIYIYAAKERTLPGIGGEFFWPFFPLPLWQIGITVRDSIRASKEVNEE